jgi:lipopolysaccharide/colanic/teichoic acid biosynthesis glycosyltransferase
MSATESHSTGTPTMTEGATASSHNARRMLMRTAVTEPGAFPVRGIPLPQFAGALTTERLDAAAKRLLDIVISLVMLVVLAPLIVLLAVLVRLDSRGPAFFQVKRLGHGNRELLMLKFRKMHNDAAGSPLASSRDERFTRLGALLARTKLDEVPQLWNVLRGQMSLVGPRPEDASFIALHREDYDRILSVRPGITGYCQLAFARESEILDPDDRERHYVERILPQKVGMDCLYVSHRSLAVDFRILWWTAMAVLFSKQVAVNRQSGHLSTRTPRAAFGTVAVERTSA